MMMTMMILMLIFYDGDNGVGDDHADHNYHDDDHDDDADNLEETVEPKVDDVNGPRTNLN